MKQTYKVTGMTWFPQKTIGFPGAPVELEFAGQNEFGLQARACPGGQSPCTRQKAWALTCLAEQSMPGEVLG